MRFMVSAVDIVPISLSPCGFFRLITSGILSNPLVPRQQHWPAGVSPKSQTCSAPSEKDASPLGFQAHTYCPFNRATEFFLLRFVAYCRLRAGSPQEQSRAVNGPRTGSRPADVIISHKARVSARRSRSLRPTVVVGIALRAIRAPTPSDDGAGHQHSARFAARLRLGRADRTEPITPDRQP